MHVGTTTVNHSPDLSRTHSPTLGKAIAPARGLLLGVLLGGAGWLGFAGLLFVL